MKDLSNVGGVIGSLIFTDFHEKPIFEMPSSYDEKTMEETGNAILHIMRALESTSYKITTAEWEYAEFRVFVRRIKGGIILLLCEKTVLLPVLNLTLNVIAKDLERDIENQQSKRSISKAIPQQETINPVFFEHLTAMLAKEVGPIAKLLIDEKLEELNENINTIWKSKVPELIEKVSLEIEKPEKRIEFKNLMLTYLRKY